MNNDEAHYPVIRNNLPKHIKKGHQLVFSRQDLSAREADLFALMIAHMKEDDWDNHTPHYKFTSQQLTEWLGIESRHIGSNLNPVASRLASRKIGIKVENEKGDIEFDYRPLFKHIKYKNGVLSIVPNDMLKAEYIEYNQGFALINTKTFFKVKKEYAKRLYELISRFKSTGFEMHAQNIDELKGMFGLLDEAGKLSKEKSSFKNNSVFMKRCVRDSIAELSNHPEISKEILFLESNDGDKGFEVIKKGRSIVSIKFLFRWLKQGTVEELNQHAAIQTIKELELKRLQHNIRLDEMELETLAIAYRFVGKEDQATKIEQSLSKRHLEKKVPEVTLDDELDSLLNKIDTLNEINDNQEY